VGGSGAAQRDDRDAGGGRFEGESFVRHGGAESEAEGLVVLGLGDSCGGHPDLLINLDLKVPAFAKGFARVAEVVVEDSAIRQAARESFRFYREQGYSLQDHRLQRL